ncbi:unnamed protein product [Rotaria sp. Silwood2]|nr:unnamed protein product [Rotaria sp. Silwood2]CAF4354926.1 unnamed protein product [Rotaria sp. Silwood2]
MKNKKNKHCLSSQRLCNGFKECLNDNDDDKFCVNDRRNISINDDIYDLLNSAIYSNVEQFLRDETKSNTKQKIKYFSLDGMRRHVEDKTNNMPESILARPFISEIIHQYESRCHHGFDLHIWLNNQKNFTENICLCPRISFYDDQCQYQNQ